MVDGPRIWKLQEDMVFELFVGDPNTGLGVTGQVANITLTIEKASIGQFYNGTDYTALSPYALTMTEVDATNSPGLYRYIIPGIPGNLDEDKYYVHASVNNPPLVVGDDYSTHIARDSEVKIYESEPIY